MVLVHEGEHVRAGDPRLLAGALALLTLTPWNQLSWWQLRRLRAAMEIDCDRRVLAQERDPRRYGNTLLTVAAQITPERSLGLAAFSESTHSLHSRIVAMTTRRSRWTTPVGVLLLTLSVLVGIQACGVYGPTEPSIEQAVTAQPEVRPAPVVVPNDTFTPISVAPRLLNRDSVTALLRDAADAATEPPPSARGAVEALRRPAESEPEREPEIEPVRPRDIGGTPIFTPFTVAPTLLNRNVVGAALEREYPALLRDAGVGGRAIVWIKIDERGVLQDVQVNQSSGHPALDAAAIRVARTMEFSPALNRDEIVPVWVSIPIQFQRR
jgi:TonB family protein